MKEKDLGELMVLLQRGDITTKEFLLQSFYHDDYVGWLSDRNEMPTEDNADLFFEETEASFESSLLYNN